MGRSARRALTTCAASALLGFVLAGSATGQDSNYWTYQYGTAANLLGGAVVGSVTDISAAYYNPGALPLIEGAEIFTTSKVFDLSSLTLDPDIGVQVDLNNLRLALAPGFVGGRVPFRFLGSDVLTYSLFTRQHFKTKIDAVGVGTLGDIDLVPPEADFLGQIRLEEDLTDYWVGLSYSTLLSSKVGLGVTLYGAYRNQRLEGLSQAQVYTETAQAIALRQTSLSYWNYRMLLKAGVTFETHGVSLGLTLTTNSLSFFGSGRALINQTQFGVLEPIFTANFEDGIGATFKSPFSLALGGTYSPDRATTVHVAAEWFSKVPNYTVLELEDFVSQSPGDTITFDVTDVRGRVLNFGLGVNHVFTPTFTGYASFRTDFSGASPEARSDIVFTDWDLYFVTAGTRLQIGTAGLTLGLAYGWGRQDKLRLGYDLGDGEGSEEAPQVANVSYRTLRFILAFTL